MNDSTTLRGRPWGWFLSELLMPLGDLAFGQRMMARHRRLREAQFWNEDRLDEYRRQRLTELVRVAYDEVPFYRAAMERAGVKPGDIRSEADLARIPVATKDALRAAYPGGTTRATGYRTFENRTSGSTGKNFVVLSDTHTAGWHRASFLLALEWAGWRFGEAHVQTGISPNRSLDKRLKDALLGCRYVSAYELGDERLDAVLETLERKRVRHLWGYPAGLYYLARRAAELGWNEPLKSVVTWGDTLYPHYREAIERAFGVLVSDTYGCSEGIQVSAQCGVGSTYHVHGLDVIVEYLDDDGAPVEAGRPGNVALTRLHPGPMPLIRYMVGDVAVSGGDRRCACGRAWPVMESIQGRDTDVIVTPSGNRLVVHFFTGVLEHVDEVGEYQVWQDELESITVRVVPRAGYGAATADAIRRRLAEAGASDLRIEVTEVDAIAPPPSGKRRFVISALRTTGQEVVEPAMIPGTRT